MNSDKGSPINFTKETISKETKHTANKRNYFENAVEPKTNNFNSFAIQTNDGVFENVSNCKSNGMNFEEIPKTADLIAQKGNGKPNTSDSKKIESEDVVYSIGKGNIPVSFEDFDKGNSECATSRNNKDLIHSIRRGDVALNVGDFDEISNTNNGRLEENQSNNKEILTGLRNQLSNIKTLSQLDNQSNSNKTLSQFEEEENQLSNNKTLSPPDNQSSNNKTLNLFEENENQLSNNKTLSHLDYQSNSNEILNQFEEENQLSNNKTLSHLDNQSTDNKTLSQFEEEENQLSNNKTLSPPHNQSSSNKILNLFEEKENQLSNNKTLSYLDNQSNSNEILKQFEEENQLSNKKTLILLDNQSSSNKTLNQLINQSNNNKTLSQFEENQLSNNKTLSHLDNQSSSNKTLNQFEENQLSNTKTLSQLEENQSYSNKTLNQLEENKSNNNKTLSQFENQSSNLTLSHSKIDPTNSQCKPLEVGLSKTKSAHEIDVGSEINDPENQKANPFNNNETAMNFVASEINRSKSFEEEPTARFVFKLPERTSKTRRSMENDYNTASLSALSSINNPNNKPADYDNSKAEFIQEFAGDYDEVDAVFYLARGKVRKKDEGCETSEKESRLSESEKHGPNYLRLNERCNVVSEERLRDKDGLRNPIQECIGAGDLKLKSMQDLPEMHKAGSLIGGEILSDIGKGSDVREKLDRMKDGLMRIPNQNDSEAFKTQECCNQYKSNKFTDSEAFKNKKIIVNRERNKNIVLANENNGKDLNCEEIVSQNATAVEVNAVKVLEVHEEIDFGNRIEAQRKIARGFEGNAGLQNQEGLNYLNNLQKLQNNECKLIFFENKDSIWENKERVEGNEEKSLLTKIEENEEKLLLSRIEENKETSLLTKIEEEGEKFLLRKIEENEEKSLLSRIEENKETSLLTKIEEGEKSLLRKIEENEEKLLLSRIEENNETSLLTKIEEESEKSLLRKIKENEEKLLLSRIEENNETSLLTKIEEGEKSLLRKIEENEEKSLLSRMEENKETSLLTKIEEEGEKSLLRKIKENEEKSLLSRVEENKETSLLTKIEEEGEKSSRIKNEKYEEKSLLKKIEENEEKPLLKKMKDQTFGAGNRRIGFVSKGEFQDGLVGIEEGRNITLKTEGGNHENNPCVFESAVSICNNFTDANGDTENLSKSQLELIRNDITNENGNYSEDISTGIERLDSQKAVCDEKSQEEMNKDLNVIKCVTFEDTFINHEDLEENINQKYATHEDKCINRDSKEILSQKVGTTDSENINSKIDEEANTPLMSAINIDEENKASLKSAINTDEENKASLKSAINTDERNNADLISGINADEENTKFSLAERRLSNGSSSEENYSEGASNENGNVKNSFAKRKLNLTLNLKTPVYAVSNEEEETLEELGINDTLKLQLLTALDYSTNEARRASEKSLKRISSQIEDSLCEDTGKINPEWKSNSFSLENKTEHYFNSSQENQKQNYLDFENSRLENETHNYFNPENSEKLDLNKNEIRLINHADEFSLNECVEEMQDFSVKPEEIKIIGGHFENYALNILSPEYYSGEFDFETATNLIEKNKENTKNSTEESIFGNETKCGLTIEKSEFESEPVNQIDVSKSKTREMNSLDVLSPVENEPRIRRCSSLKTGKTPPGTPGRKKIVRFADVLGLDLADVRTFLDDIPKIPSSAYNDLTDEIDYPTYNQSAKNQRVLLGMFRQPGGQPNFLEKVTINQVMLENAVIEDPISFSIRGIVRVRNIDFDKQVHVRYSLDSWKTFSDLQAVYVDKSCDGFTDKFTFLLYAYSLSIGQKIEFAVRFQSKGTQFWDNNCGANYSFQCLPASNSTPTTNYTLLSSGVDDQIATFYYMEATTAQIRRLQQEKLTSSAVHQYINTCLKKDNLQSHRITKGEFCAVLAVLFFSVLFLYAKMH